MWRRFLLILGYLSFTLVIVLITVALVAYGNDYTYDFKSHSIVQKGHIILESVPSGVAVNDNGKQLRRRTPLKAAYSVGVHQISLIKDGFEPWQKTLRVVAGRVTLVNYILLLPKERKTTVLDTRPQVTAQAISKDHRHLAYVTGGAEPGVYTLNVPNGKAVRLYTPKAGETIKDVSWSDDASHVLIESSVNAVPQFWLAAAGSEAAPADLTAQFNLNLTGAHFSGSNWRQLYWLGPDGGLRRLDVSDSSVSVVLANSVSQFWVQPDRVLYVTKTELGSSLWSVDGRGKRQELIQALVDSPSYAVALSKFDGQDELAVVPAKTGVATLYSEIFSETPVAKVLAHDVADVSFAPDGHELALMSPQGLQVYDLERSADEQSFVVYKVDQPGALQSLTWFDENHLLSVRDGQLYWSEFDGANTVVLGAAYGGLPANSTSDKRSVVMYAPASGAAGGVKVSQIQVK